MAIERADRVAETTTTTGTGTYSLAGAKTGFEGFAARITSGNTVEYCATNGVDYEIGVGTFTDSSPDTLSRDTIIQSSNGDAAVNWSSGTRDIFITLPASRAAVKDGSGNLTLGNTALKLQDTDASHTLTFKPGSNLTANRTLTVTTGDADRTLSVLGTATVSQDYSTTGEPQFRTLTLAATNTTDKPLIVNGAASASEPLQEWQVAGSVLTKVLAGGSLDLQSTTTATSGIVFKNGNRFLHDFSHPTGDTAIPTGRNVFVGESAGNFTMGSTATTTNHASFNVAIGYQALTSNTIGQRNTAIGYTAMNVNTEGDENAAIGRGSLVGNTTGDRNVGAGYLALLSNTTGGNNIAAGYLSLGGNTTGGNNVGLGSEAGRKIAGGSTDNQTSSRSVYLGDSTKAGADGNTNEIVIGYDATGAGSDTAVLGNSSVTATTLRGDVSVGTAATGSLILPVYTDGQRPSAGTAGRVIYNSDDGQLNVDDGTNWTLPDGTTT